MVLLLAVVLNVFDSRSFRLLIGAMALGLITAHGLRGDYWDAMAYVGVFLVFGLLTLRDVRASWTEGP